MSQLRSCTVLNTESRGAHEEQHQRFNTLAELHINGQRLQRQLTCELTAVGDVAHRI